jgi:hypothetical protein
MVGAAQDRSAGDRPIVVEGGSLTRTQTFSGRMTIQHRSIRRLMVIVAPGTQKRPWTRDNGSSANAQERTS